MTRDAQAKAAGQAHGAPEGDTWDGRFPWNEIISLLEVNRRFNLAESTSQDLELGDLLAMADLETLKRLRLGYGSAEGSEALRQAISQMVGVPANQVVTTQGTAMAMFMLAFELCRPGDEVVAMTPCFPPSRDALYGCGVTVREHPLRFEEKFRLNVEALKPLLSPATKLVCLASPQNPSGVCTPRTTIAQLLDLMAERAPNARLFIDETYRVATYGNKPPEPSMAAADPRIITGASISKAHGAPGLRVGWLTVPDPVLWERLRVAKMNMIISGSVLDETLATVVLNHQEQILAKRRLLLSEALGMLQAWLRNEAARVEWVEPDAGALCCLRLKAGAFDDAAIQCFWKALPDHELQLASGSWFGATPREFRLGFGYLPLDRLPLALAALSGAMNQVQQSQQGHEIL